MFQYYELTPERKISYNPDLRAKRETFNSYFEAHFLYYVMNEQNEIEPVVSEDYMADHNNFISAPAFRAEWNMFSSMPHIINTDNIYIDRGINSAFEKHLKLQEIRTMEALENYGINYFKITKY